MASEANKTNGGGGVGGNGAGGGGGFGSRINYYLNSGDKKHVMVGLAAMTVIFGIPWYLMNRGTKHSSHQDYLEKADKARSERLSASSSSAK